MISTKLMPADYLTKNAPKDMLTQCRFLIGNVKPNESSQIITNVVTYGGWNVTVGQTYPLTPVVELAVSNLTQKSQSILRVRLYHSQLSFLISWN